MNMEHCDYSVEQQRYRRRIELQRHQRRDARRMQFYALAVITGLVIFWLAS